MKTVLMCHHDDDANRVALARWLGSFSKVAGLVVIEEGKKQKRNRIMRQVKRVGLLRFVDVIAYRVYHRLVWQARDAAFERKLLADVAAKYLPLPEDVPVHKTATPNTPETRAFLEGIRPDLMIARCRFILKREIFAAPSLGTFVMHPGICPEYRNSHGCFWALANRDLDKVGMTLLKVDQGIDTGPVYGFFSYPYDERGESHITIQHRVVFDNLDRIRDTLLAIERGSAATISTAGRTSGTWGQPWLTRYFSWKRAARQRALNSNAGAS